MVKHDICRACQGAGTVTYLLVKSRHKWEPWTEPEERKAVCPCCGGTGKVAKPCA